MGTDLTDISLTTRDANIYMDGSNFNLKRSIYAGAVVVTGQNEVIWSQAVPRGTSTQRAEIIALTQNSRWDERKK